LKEFYQEKKDYLFRRHQYHLVMLMWIWLHIPILRVVCGIALLEDYLYVCLFLALLDIPVYDSRIQSLHALFTLYLGFKNSEVKKGYIY
jgi:hypothetical protein